jgi:peptidoglycan hydrolase-like protein with peptidoglycan-binding domain
VATGFYLLDNRNPNGKKFYPSRTATVKYIVIHTAENLPDVVGPDSGAEAIARYLAGTDRDASCHECVDTDSVVRMLPDDYTAWHAKGYNANGWGLEICTQAAKWSSLPADYRERLYRAAAARARRAAITLGVPLRKTTAGGAAGFLGHTEVDPGRRSDPGKDFDWAYFMSLVNEVQPGTSQPTPVAPAKPSKPIGAVQSAPPAPYRPLKATTKNSFAKQWQAKMAQRGWSIAVDGVYGPDSAEVCKKFQREKGLVVDGIVGPQTWAMTWKAQVTK